MVSFRGVGFAVFLGYFFLGAPWPVLAAPDEIQVYTDDLNAIGESELEVHTNFVSAGRERRQYDGERPPYHVLRVTPEYSMGLADNWDIGFYLPMAYDADEHAGKVDGAKFRIKVLRKRPLSAGTLFYGLNTEVGYSLRRVEETPWNSEFRGILGIRTDNWLVVLNPVIEMGWARGAAPELEGQIKIDRKIGRGFSLGVEHYSGFGPVGGFLPIRAQEQNGYGIVEYDAGPWEINIGIGRGWTQASDERVVKFIFSVPFRPEGRGG